MPSAGEDIDDLRFKRIAKRVNGVGSLKRTPAYILSALHRWPLPPVPDPYDESVSKRSWERSMMFFREALRKTLHVIHREQLSTYDE